jgi:hypothetical protein
MDMKNGMMVMVGGVGLALYAGCANPAAGSEESDNATESTDAAANEPAPILQLDLGAGHAVKFYEPSPGALFIVEQAARGERLALSELSRVDALELFAALRPNQPVPAVLGDAHARALEAAAARPASLGLRPQVGGGSPAASLSTGAAESAGAGVATTQQALTSSADPTHFVNTDHGCDWANSFSFCRISWANGMFIDSGSTDSAICIVDHYAGNGITVQLTADTTVLPQSQAVGTEVAYSWGIVGGDVHRRMDILNASGDRFHAGCRFTD